jgi:hypothetical protein
MEQRNISTSNIIELSPDMGMAQLTRYAPGQQYNGTWIWVRAGQSQGIDRFAQLERGHAGRHRDILWRLIDS